MPARSPEALARKAQRRRTAPHRLEYDRSYGKSYSSMRRAEARAVVDAAKDKPCADCGGEFPTFVMDFDHVRGEKTGDISRMVSRGTRVELILDEIEKCDVVCSNCHRIRTFT